MAAWQRRIQSLTRQLGSTSAAFSSSSRFKSTLSRGDVNCSLKLRTPPSSANLMRRPFYHYLQRMGISNSRELSADVSEQAVPSPLTPLLTSSGGSEEARKVMKKPEKVQAVLKKIQQSPKKVNLVAALVRGMRVEDALLQLKVQVKRASQTVHRAIHMARAHATHNFGMDGDRLIVAEAFVGKGLFKKRLTYHAKGRSGIMHRPECRVTVIVRETTPEEEAEIARLKVEKWRKSTKREKRLVPHTVIETTPVWKRKPKEGRYR